MQRRSLIALAATTALAAGGALAQGTPGAYPVRPIRLIVPFAPGGTTDIIARVVADPLARVLGQPVIVDNKAGGGGTVGANEVAKAAPDGYVLGIATASTTATNPAINPKVPYNPVTDFTPVVNIAATPNIIAVNPKYGPRNYAQFLAELKAKPGAASYATPGSGSIAHLVMEAYKSLTGTFVTHIPYRGAGPALNDVVGGQVPIMVDNLPSTLPFVKSGKLIPIVVAAPQRLAALPNVPTFKEVGLEPVNRLAYYGIVGPKGMPREIVDKLNAAVREVLKDPAVRKRIEATDSIIAAGTPEQFGREMREELAIYRKVVAEQKLQLD